jgi:CRISPR-associated exonuclease Cas4
MDNPIMISYLNDFIFCPVSIYFHQLYGDQEKITYQCSDQLNGTHAHRAVDSGTYSTKKEMLQGIAVYSEKFNLMGKIDVFDNEKGILTERKKKIKVIYDGYVFQIYAQYYALVEMGYTVHSLRLYSMDDNKSYSIKLPEEDDVMNTKFLTLLSDIEKFQIADFQQENAEKCRHCIYESACSQSAL